MANADELLRDAQYAFQSISFGNTRENRAFRARAKSAARKIIRKFPDSFEVGQAQVILNKLEGRVVAPKFAHTHALDDQVRSRDPEPKTPLAMPWVPISRPEQGSKSSAFETHQGAHRRREHGKKDDAELNLGTIWEGFRQLAVVIQLTAAAVVLFIVAAFGVFPFIVMTGFAYYLVSRMEKKVPAQFDRIRYQLLKPIDAWLKENKSGSGR